MNAIICDKCDRVFPVDGAYHSISVDKDAFYPSKIPTDYHLCDDCLSRMRGWIEQKEVE